MYWVVECKYQRKRKVLKNMKNPNFSNDDILVLASGSMIRGWSYDTHCRFNLKDDNTILEVLRSVWRK